MQKDTNKEFDLYVKEMMDGAQATPSPRVWQAISARLAAGAAPQAGAVAPAASAGVSGAASGSARGAFRWGWVALAAAAAVAALLLIPNNSNLSDISREHEVLAQAAVVEIGEIPAPVALKAVPARVSVAEAKVSEPVAEASVSSQEPRQKEAKSSDPLAFNEGGPSKSAENEGEVTVAEEPATQTTATKHVSEPEADPFAAMAYEDSRNASRKASRKAGSALWLGGAVGGNEAGTGGAAYAAKSSNPNYIENSIVENSASNYGIPVSFGAGVKMGFTERLSASAGVDYSFLSRSFNGTYTPAGSAPTVGEISHEMRYIGIPVGVYYNLISKGNVGFYLFGLGEAEWCLGNSYNIAGTVVSEKVAGTQFSAGGGFGVEFRLSPTLSLYADPAVRYYFDCGHPNNIRSEKQLMLNFNAGLRFNL
jgi:hypothetical protein